VSAPSRDYYVYIMTNRSYTALYTGVTNDLARRAWQHRHEPAGFVKRYRTNILVYFEHTTDVWSALSREKQIKNRHRADKIELIGSFNSEWHDLYETLIAPSPHQILLRQDDKKMRDDPAHPHPNVRVCGKITPPTTGRQNTNWRKPSPDVLF